jgi:hypothetical protein
MFDASLSTFQPISVTAASKAYIFSEFLTGFSDFLNANNPETAKASPTQISASSRITASLRACQVSAF